jgi:hypothetical protein
MLQACLGMELRADPAEVALHAPRLPEFIDSMEIRQLSVGPHAVDLQLQRYGNHVGIDVARKLGDLAVHVSM